MFSPIAPIANAQPVASNCSTSSSTETVIASASTSTIPTNTFFGGSAGFINVFQRLPLANLFNSGRTLSLRPAITYDTRDNRLFPTSGVFLQVVGDDPVDVPIPGQPFGFSTLKHAQAEGDQAEL